MVLYSFFVYLICVIERMVIF